MNIIEATRSYEDWLAKHITIVAGDLAVKHKAMASDPFVFLRATFYRWAQVFPELCPELMKAIRVRSVCDLHVENYSTWRDSEGRLIWGINDFDEACAMPYTFDLVRLSTSAKLAIRASHLSIKVRRACKSILEGYREGLSDGVKPFVLAEENLELGKMATSVLRHPAIFWRKLDTQVDRSVRVPKDVKALLARRMPESGLACEFGKRTAGKGSLGRPRFVALASWNGGRIAREAKRVVPSACVWAENGGKGEKHVLADKSIRASLRMYSGDPSIVIDGNWLLRRLAPDCSRVEFSDLPTNRNAEALLHSMGRELANVHLGCTPRCAAKVLADLRKRDDDWLQKAVKTMTMSVRNDHDEWERNFRN